MGAKYTSAFSVGLFISFIRRFSGVYLAFVACRPLKVVATNKPTNATDFALTFF